MDIPEDFSELYFLSPDNHCTYLKLMFIAPFRSRLVIEGDFPHCRFMSHQVTPPFDPDTPCTGGLGVPEVPIVDADIEPDPGHVNPFRVGADRTAADRHYRVCFKLKMGNAVRANPKAFVPPAYRAPGNMRMGGPFYYAGSYGSGCLLPGVVWTRYYAPDHGAGPLGGVALPKAHLELPSGEKFWIRCDLSICRRRQNVPVPGFVTWPQDPPVYEGPGTGWFKMYGIWHMYAQAVAYTLAKPYGKLPKEWTARPIRRADEAHFRRGPHMPPPGNYECAATCCNYINYLIRPMSIGKGKVVAITGKLPLTPKTRNGEKTMTQAECRYWSLAHTADSPDSVYPGILYGCLMDDEIALDRDRRYVICFSRKRDRPANARVALGVTWQDWGPQAHQVMNIRWLSVMPEWHLPRYAPDEERIPWSVGAWIEPTFDKTLISENRPNALGPYHPVLHYLTREEFEELGTRVGPDALPKWRRK